MKRVCIFRAPASAHPTGVELPAGSNACLSAPRRRRAPGAADGIPASRRALGAGALNSVAWPPRSAPRTRAASTARSRPRSTRRPNRADSVRARARPSTRGASSAARRISKPRATARAPPRRRSPPRARAIRPRRALDVGLRSRRIAARRASALAFGARRAAQHPRERGLARVDRRREALEPQQRSRAAASNAAAETSCGEPSAALASKATSRRRRSARRSVRSVSGGRRHAQGHRREHGERAPGAREQLRHVVARHVLHDAAAGAKRRPRPVDRRAAEEVIARRAGRHAARAGEVRREHCRRWSRGAGRCRAAAEVGRLEREPLRAPRERPLDRRERRSPRAQLSTSSSGSYADDARQAREVEHVGVELGAPTPRFAPPPTGSSARGCVATISATSAASRGRSARARRRGAPARVVLAVAHQNRGRSGKRSAPACTCSRPSSAQRRSVGNTLPGLKRTSGSNACLIRCCTRDRGRSN